MESTTHLSNLRDFVDEVARCRRDGEEAPDGAVFVWELDDAVDRLNDLIGEARRVRDAWAPAVRAINTLGIKDWSERLTCDEVEAVAVAFRAIGCDDPASRLLQSHVDGDCANGAHDLLLGGQLSIDPERARRGTPQSQERESARAARSWRELGRGLQAPVDETGLIERLGHVVRRRGSEAPGLEGF